MKGNAYMGRIFLSAKRTLGTCFEVRSIDSVRMPPRSFPA
ncbi:hypothetical protein HMPREF3190_00413 [Umbribacter vaginalis]|nr:hypothetical protein HMPREF3190_00413 [Coriobacteriales bacterium DNF00809]